eukprot:maker-scaffold919_size81109-snap-gene-0.14 protein:Tk04251 transcript:maker-scaffold919_size81109-snap-gene-0.14-mRNA-1 annotation:"family transcriptional regulator"
MGVWTKAGLWNDLDPAGYEDDVTLEFQTRATGPPPLPVKILAHGPELQTSVSSTIIQQSPSIMSCSQFISLTISLGASLLMITLSAPMAEAGYEQGVSISADLSGRVCMGQELFDQYENAKADCSAELNPAQVPMDEESNESGEFDRQGEAPFNLLDFLLGFSMEKLCMVEKMGWKNAEDNLDLMAIEDFFVQTPMNGTVDFGRVMNLCSEQTESATIMDYFVNLSNLGFVELSEEYGQVFANLNGWVNMYEAMDFLTEADFGMASRLAAQMNFLQCLGLCDQVGCQLFVSKTLENALDIEENTA